MNSQFLLMRDKRFLPLFVTQFLGAFHDNLFKNALIVLILYRVATQTGMDAQTQSLLTTAAAGTLVLPFFLFSAMGGQLADKFPKNTVMRHIKLVEIAIALLGAASLMTGSLVLSFINLFALGAQSAFFGPCKYSILPEHLKRDELIGGNALLNTGTFLAILLGTIVGTIVMAQEHGEFPIGILMVITALIGYGASRFIPQCVAANPSIKFNPNIATDTYQVLKYGFSQGKDITLTMLGKGWFFFVGSLFLSQFPNYVKGTLQAEETVLTFFTVLFSVGIGLGGLLNNRLLHGAVTAAFVPIAAIGLTVGSLDLYWATAHVARLPDGALMGFSEFMSHPTHWRLILDVTLIAAFGGLYVVPLAAILQDRTPEETRAQVMAGSAIVDSLFMVVSAVVASALIATGWSVTELFYGFALANLAVAVYICRLLPDYLFKTILQGLFKLLYRVEIRGIENVEKAGPRAVIVGNHVSLLDPPLLAAFLPGRPMFAVNTQVSQWWWVRPFLKLVDAFPIDPTNPYSIKAMIRKVEEDRHLVIFPEGRLTSTGSLMKIYDGPGLIADKAEAMILPIRIDGAQYTGFARLRHKLPFKRFPKITITIMEPLSFKIDETLKGRARRMAASRQLYDVLEDMMLQSTDTERTLWEALLNAEMLQGEDFICAEDVEFKPMRYADLIKKSKVLGAYLNEHTRKAETVGVLLPNSLGAVVSFFALQSGLRVPAMLNFTMGSQALCSACVTGDIRMVLTSRRFVEMGKLQGLVDALSQQIKVIYLEDLSKSIGLLHKLNAFCSICHDEVDPHTPAVVLFTSGSEGAPKGVVLSHANLLSNIAQLSSRVAFNRQDIVFNCLPMFHSFGMTGGTLLPLLSGVKTFLYPNPLHVRIVPELVYATNATILFGTDTFLNGYARMANPYDFYGVRYIFAGAEKVKESTRKLYMDKFGVRILEGYGATETSPVIAVNSPMHTKDGTVGRVLSGMTLHLEEVPGVDEGGRLFVQGPNVMLGYYKDDKPGILQPPEGGWHDTGDIVCVDAEGFIRILGRAKRFAKIAGEMVSLSVVETMASALWPDHMSAVVAVPDSKKGEQLVLLTTQDGATRSHISSYASSNGIPALAVPATVLTVGKIPVLGTGKTDYTAVKELAESLIAVK
ncbi:MAG: acyl-[ACP]--phospholipid O-acyltransferase [Pseudobdellovibrionaceae bacterium]|jgi:acyl-[acyl-carrier-protein]-phospholipid O-acyltransferase/long-chain-fatty-acid--[acyl-carrier-protein] ligase|nr:acyl-[ACP]--phospholipid O-acyltransferase [Pseudobdellovibrionaceae bacterium]